VDCKAIQTVADVNQKLCKAVFSFIPGNRALSDSPEAQGDFRVYMAHVEFTMEVDRWEDAIR